MINESEKKELLCVVIRRRRKIDRAKGEIEVKEVKPVTQSVYDTKDVSALISLFGYFNWILISGYFM